MHPELDIHVRETLTPKLIKEVAEGRLDHRDRGAAGVGTVADRGRAAFRRTSCWCGRARTAGNAGAERTRCCARCGCCCSRKAIASATRRCRSATCSPRRRAKCWTQARCRPLVQMVGAGIGVTLIPEMAVTVETRSAPVSVVAFQESAALAHHRHGLAQDQPARLAAPADLRSGLPRRRGNCAHRSGDGAKEPVKRAGAGAEG